MLKRFVLVLLILIVAFVLVSSIVSYRTLRKSLPQTKGTIELDELSDPVRVYRDERGVPHIFAKNENDLYFAFGYVVAQDRVWQLEALRRAVNGRLSEVMGDTTVALDQLMLTLGFKRMANEFYPRLATTSKKMIKAYVAGINAYLRDHQDKVPLEMMLLNFKPEFWHPEDCLAASRLIAWRLSIGWYVELVAEKLRQKIGSRRATELLTDYAPEWPVITDRSTVGWDFGELTAALHTLNQFLGPTQLPEGSNNWAVAGTKTAHQQPILANDPHLILTNPSQWYMVHLNAPGVDVAGFSLPGNPAVVVGWNRDIAWGFTNAMIDDADFFVETINDQDSSLYLRDGKWAPLKQVEYTLPIRGKETLQFSVWVTDHGPLIQSVHPHLKHSRQRISFSWTGQTFSDEPLAFYRLNRARNWQEFLQAIRLFKVPAQNVAYADREGNIGYWCAGSVPIRQRPNGMFPASTYDWIGTIPFEQLPHAFNPASGFVASANNKITSSSYPYYLSYLWEPPARITRIREVLSERQDLTVEDMKSLQTDVLSPFARFLVPKTLPQLKTLADQDPRYREIFQFMQGWDFQMRAESVSAAIFQVFLQQLIRNTFSDEIQDSTLFSEFLFVPNLSLKALQRIFERNREYWFDNHLTPDHQESMGEIVSLSWQQAVEALRNRLGDKTIQWRWDRLHRITFKHYLGDLPMLGRFLNIGPLPLGGSYTTVNNGTFSFSRPFDCVIGPSFRMIVDFSRPGQAQVVCPPGQVGHPFSSHYQDQTNLWLNGLYWTFETDSVLITRSDYDLLLLKPPN